MPPCDPPTAPRGIFDPDCPYLVPDALGMSLLLTSPAWLLAIPAMRRRRGDPLVSGGIVAVGFIAVLDLMHFSQGWVQYGYRFSLDWAPFALPLVALGLDGLTGRWRKVGPRAHRPLDPHAGLGHPLARAARLVSWLDPPPMHAGPAAGTDATAAADGGRATGRALRSRP